MQLLLTEGSIFGKPRDPGSSDPQKDKPVKNRHKKIHNVEDKQEDEDKRFHLGLLAESDTLGMIMEQTPRQNKWLARQSVQLRNSVSKKTPIHFVASKNSMKHLSQEIRRDTMLHDLEAQMNKYKIVSIEISDFPIDLTYEYTRVNSGTRDSQKS